MIKPNRTGSNRAKSPPPEPVNSRVGGSSVPGSVAVENGAFAGRDLTTGVPYDQFATFYEGMRKIFSASQLQNPPLLHQNLIQLRTLHDELYEWKQLHNDLDEIIYAMAPFEVQVNLFDKNPRSIDAKSLRNLWRGVAIKVDALIQFAKGIQHIGIRYELLPEGMKGERWAIQTCAGCTAISENLGISLANPSVAPAQIVDAGSFTRWLGAKPDWWDAFYEQAECFRTNVLQFMTETDKSLLEKASELYHLSQMVFGSTDGEIENSG